MNWPESLRRFVETRALSRCEYCLIQKDDTGFPHEIDHVISRKHGGTGHSDNLALACYVCNRYKGSDIGSIPPGSGELVRLFDPRRDHWADHFRITGPVIEPLTNIGIATCHLLQLNSASRVVERQALQVLDRYPRS